MRTQNGTIDHSSWGEDLMNETRGEIEAEAREKLDRRVQIRLVVASRKETARAGMRTHRRY